MSASRALDYLTPAAMPSRAMRNATQAVCLELIARLDDMIEAGDLRGREAEIQNQIELWKECNS